MSTPLVKSLDRPDEQREFPHGGDAFVMLGGHPLRRSEFRPGWRWSSDIRPMAGTTSCQVHHRGYLITGTLHIETDDGTGSDIVAGDAFEILPGHDAWVVGDVACHLVDWGPIPTPVASAPELAVGAGA